MNRSWQLGTGLLLTGLAGYVDALGFVRLGGLYTSFMSGNTTQLAVFGAEAKLHKMLLPAILLVAFLTGSVLGSGLAILVPSRWTTPVVLAYESLLILSGLACILIGGFSGGIAVLVAALCFIGLRQLMVNRLGGTTGDTAGALLELLEVAVLISLVL